MGERFQPDKTPEHNGKGGEKLRMIDVPDCRERNIFYRDIARPPDSANERDNHHRDERLQIRARAGAA